MAKKRRISDKQTSIRVGNISDISGAVSIAGGIITTNHTTTGLSATEIKQLFDRLYIAIEANAKTSSADIGDLKTKVKDIQSKITEAAEERKGR